MKYTRLNGKKVKKLKDLNSCSYSNGKYKNKKRGMIGASMIKKTVSKLESVILKVPFIIRKEKKGFVAECVDLNIVTQGNTIKEVRKNIAEAITLHLETACKLGVIDDEIEKLGVVKKNNQLVVAQRELENAPVSIPTCLLHLF